MSGAPFIVSLYAGRPAMWVRGPDYLWRRVRASGETYKDGADIDFVRADSSTSEHRAKSAVPGTAELKQLYRKHVAGHEVARMSREVREEDATTRTTREGHVVHFYRAFPSKQLEQARSLARSLAARERAGAVVKLYEVQPGTIGVFVTKRLLDEVKRGEAAEGSRRMADRNFGYGQGARDRAEWKDRRLVGGGEDLWDTHMLTMPELPEGEEDLGLPRTSAVRPDEFERLSLDQIAERRIRARAAAARKNPKVWKPKVGSRWELTRTPRVEKVTTNEGYSVVPAGQGRLRVTPVTRNEKTREWWVSGAPITMYPEALKRLLTLTRGDAVRGYYVSNPKPKPRKGGKKARRKITSRTRRF